MFTPAIPIRIPNWRLIAACRPAANAYASTCPVRSGQVCCTVTAMSDGVFNGYGLPGRFIGGSLFLERIDEISEPLHCLNQY